jgi:hypothetical protein
MLQGTDGDSQQAGDVAGGSDATVSAVANTAPAIRSKENYPKRPLSAIDLFFRLERERVLQDQPTRLYTHAEVDHAADSANNDRESESSAKGKPKRRRHRKTNHPNPVVLRDLTRMVNGNWSQLEDSQKTIFQSRASVEKEAYAPPPPKKRRRMKLATTKHAACAEKGGNDLGTSTSGISVDTTWARARAG